MKQIYTTIIRYLNEQHTWITSTELSQKFSVSKRSIKTYIADLNFITPSLVESSRLGYRVNRDKLLDFKTNHNFNIPESPTERLSYIIKKLISTDSALSLCELADEMYISKSTLQKDIKRVKKKCLSQNLVVEQENNLIYLKGSEKSKRHLIRILIGEELNSNFVDLEKIQRSFSNYDFDFIKKIVVETFSDYDFLTNDYALINIVIHIAISIERITNNLTFPNSDSISNTPVHNRVNKMAEKIVEKISIHFSIAFPKREIIELALLISANGTNLNYTQISEVELEKTVGISCLNLVNECLNKIYDLYSIDCTDSNFLVRFTIHINNLLNRLSINFSCKNPMTQTIKKECPLIYDCAVQVSHIIQKKVNKTISEDEIAFIAFHFGFAFEIQKVNSFKITCTLLIPNYYNMNIKILEKIQKNFSEELNIENIITDEKDLKYIKTNLIISTIDIKQLVNIPYVIINPFFTFEDRQRITSQICYIQKTKKKSSFEKNLALLLNKNFFVYSESKQNYTEIIEKACNKLVETSIVKKNFFSNVMEREKLASTAYGSIAIPHSLNMDANKSTIYIIVNPKGISWNNNKVNIVFLISIDYSNRKIFQHAFDDLVTICSDEQNIQRLCKKDTFQTFSEELIKCYSEI